MLRCKAPEILRSEAYWSYAATTKDEGNAADGLFSAACYTVPKIPLGFTNRTMSKTI